MIQDPLLSSDNPSETTTAVHAHIVPLVALRKTFGWWRIAFGTLFIAVIIWLVILTSIVLHQSSNNSSSDNNTTSYPASLAIVALPLSSSICKNGSAILNNGTPVSWSSSLDTGVGLIIGGGTSVYIGAQKHAYISFDRNPNHLSVVALNNDTVLLGLGSQVVIGLAGPDEWVTGASVLFNGTSGAASSHGWSSLYPLPILPDEIVLMSSDIHYAILVAIAGGGTIAIQVDLINLSLTLGPVVHFVTGPSVDTDTAVINPNTFVISYYEDIKNAVDLVTIAGYLNITSLKISFSPPIIYAPNHMFHQILALSSGLYVLAFPNDSITDLNSLASPMGILIAGVNTNTNSITIYSADGHGMPWLLSTVLGYYFFDLLLVDTDTNSDGITATIAMAVVDHSVGDAITVVTFTVSASINGQQFDNVRVLYDRQLTVTSASATIGYNYFAMQPLYTINSISMTNRNDEEQQRDLLIAWQDTGEQNAVEALIVSYDIESGFLSLIMDTSEVAPPVPNNDDNHWWVAAGPLGDGRVMLLTTLDATGNITIIEHRQRILGLVSTNTAVQCNSGTQLVDVSVAGLMPISASSVLPSVAAGMNMNVWSSTRGHLLAGTESFFVNSKGDTVTILVADDSCFGILLKNAAGLWISRDSCLRQ